VSGDRPGVELELRMLAELGAVKAKLQELCEAQADVARHMLAADDRRIGNVLLPLLAKIFGSESFGAGQVIAAVLPSTLNGKVLEELIGDRLREAGAAHIIGRLLARLEGAQFKSYRLVDAGDERGIRFWRVSTPSKPATKDTPAPRR
jgi:hypothetical protein